MMKVAFLLVLFQFLSLMCLNLSILHRGRKMGIVTTLRYMTWLPLKWKYSPLCHCLQIPSHHPLIQ
uniref:Uncharacterized protein n=1 Tax=Arundo donax TaxID=35708 RepID=A0A0A9EP54_ARUDO